MTDTSDAAHPGLGPATDVSADGSPDGSPGGGAGGEQAAPTPATIDPAQYADDGLGAGDGVLPGGAG